ncbi:MAG TPA: chemotaxis protein CheB [Permianibacter sp.]|nr:chemotaxis protein CheB [Permianibacter sp.]
MKSQALRIGLIGSGDDSSSKLLRLLTEQGMQIVHALLPKELTDAHIAASDLDVWLLDLDDSHWHSQLDELMDRSPVPIFFNEHQSIEGQQHLDYWCRNLISRMFELVADVPGLPPTTAAISAPTPATTARSGETLNLAFAQKAESKPSDDLNVVPSALDPDLLQEMEELEQLLQRQSGKHADALSDLDAELPLPVTTTVAASKTASASEPKPASTPAPTDKPAGTDNAASRSAALFAQAEFSLREPASAKSSDVAANAGIEAMPDDPIAAAKARAAKIQQAAAAARASVGAPAESAAAPANSANKPTAAAAPAAPTATAPKATGQAAATPSGNSISAKSAGAAPTPAPQNATAAAPATNASAPATASSKPVTPAAAPVSAAGTIPKATAVSADATPVIAPATTPATTPVTTPVTTPATTPAATKPTTQPASQAPLASAPTAAVEQKRDAAPVSVAKTAADAAVVKPDAVSRLAAATPVVPPPEPHDWPQFPPPIEPTPTTLEADPAFAPMQPQPATGPMREPAKPAPVQLVRAAPASKPPRPSAPAATPELPFAEPVPTLTAISDDALEFETVAFEPAEGDGPAMAGDEHPELDVPMLESVVVASDFEAVEAPAPILPCDLWVLGASLGGPAALKRFFAALNQPLPICFLLAQHIDAHFLPVLGKILEQANPFYPVQVLARPGLIEPGTLLLAPIEKRLRFLDAGQIVNGARSWTPPYSPCIDDVLSDVAAAYPGQVHAIVFSGMGEDGVNGARAVADCRGEVWVQDADSCASSVMPDAIDKAGLARYRATPEDLAARLMARYNPAVGGQHLA